MHEHVDLVNPVVEVWVFHGFSIFISRLLWLSGEAVRAMSSTRDVNKGKVEQQDGDDPMVHAGGARSGFASIPLMYLASTSTTKFLTPIRYALSECNTKNSPYSLSFS